MYRTFMLSVAFMLSTGWAIAQQGYPQSKSSQPPPEQRPSNSGQVSAQDQYDTANSDAQASEPLGTQRTVQGCVQVAGTVYSLVADDGTTYRLTNETAILHDRVGQRVEVTGTTYIRTKSATQQGTASNAMELNGIHVQSVKPISNTCQPASR
jgi:Protein of unknown function (DUF5818)